MPPPQQRNPHDRHLSLYVATVLERVAHFLVISLLGLFLNERWHLSEAAALSLCGLYGGSVYICAIFGGWLADRLNAHRRAAQIGALCLGTGYLFLALASLGLMIPFGVLTFGHALLKPSLAALFGRLRGHTPESRFRQLYVLVNLGATAAPFLAELCLSYVGWWAPFILAGLLAFLAAASLSISVSAVDATVQTENPPVTERPRVASVAVVCVLAVVFFAAFQQTEGALIFWARDHTDRSFLGAEIPTLWLVCLPGLCLLLMSVPISALWTALSRRARAVSPLLKVRAGLLLAALAFGILAAMAYHVGPSGKIAMRWLVLLNLLLAVAELCVVPVAMALVHGASPPKRKGLGMGLWFVVVAVGNWLAGQIAGSAILRSQGGVWLTWAILVAGLLVAWLVSVIALRSDS